MATSLDTLSTQAPAPLPRRSLLLPTSWALLGLLLVSDQLLLPMLHAGGVPYKLSFFLCGLWLIDSMARRERDPLLAEDFKKFALAIGLIVGCALLGELWLAANYTVPDYGQTIRSILIYTLVTLAFGLGLSAGRFRLEWLIPIFFFALALNLAAIFLKSAIPPWFIDLYYSDQQVAALADNGVKDSRDLLEMVRPRGLFSNPNVSAHMVNVIVLFIHLGLRWRRMKVPGALVGMSVIALPLLLSMLLASRGEFLVAMVLGFLNFRVIFRASSPRNRARLVLVAIAAPLLLAIGLMRAIDMDALIQNWDRVLSIANAVSQQSDLDPDEKKLGGIARPLLTLQAALPRFVFSPVFGSGFSATDGPPFSEGTEYLHNDWFRLLATSGLVGFCAMLWIIWRYCRPLGWIALIPFVLPGVVNTFMLLIPAFMFYFFMIGVMRAKSRADAG